MLSLVFQYNAILAIAQMTVTRVWKKVASCPSGGAGGVEKAPIWRLRPWL